ncbi:MAG: PTS lactose/cellobiose transporter subunit IIA [Hungatella sp.]|jgi:PTS system cellobiose-specific IIA component|nr:PTS lactose/cellobiose transporter subunit IIA [Hungatella sp.]
MDPELLNITMKIILCAGDGRNHLDQAFKAAKEFDFDNADKYLELAREDLQKAHQEQTEIIQAEAAGTSHEYGLLFIHAQDTLMTIMSEFRMATYFIDTFKCMEKMKA